MLPTKLMKFIVHCSSPLNNELQFCRRSFLLSLKLCQNGFKTFKLIDPFLFWTNVALMHYLSSHFRLHLYLSLFQATSFLIIVFASTAEMCKKVLKFSKLPCNPDSKIKIFFFNCSFSCLCVAVQAAVSRACGFADIIWRFPNCVIKYKNWKITEIQKGYRFHGD